MTARAVTCVWVAVVIVAGAAAPDSSSSWITRTQPQQTLHGLMVSIDERLQTLENTRWELTLKQAEQRIESLESTIRRLDSTVQDRLDKLERNLNSKELKDELTVEKLSHKMRDVMDSSYDRYNRRLGYTEERLEMVLKKMQMTTEASLNRLEKQQEDLQNEVVEAVALLEDLKSQSSTTEDKINNTHRAIQQHIQRLITPSHEELLKISGSLEHLGSRLNGSLAPAGAWGGQNDGPPSPDMVTSLRKEITSEGTKISSKLSNMYNDLWRRVVSVEGLIKDLNSVANSTQRQVVEVRSLVNPEHREFPGDSQENFLEVALDALERKLQRRLLDLGRKVEDRLDTLSATQNLVMDSCFDGGICRGLESRLSQVLEKIFDIFSDKIEGYSNRTLDLDGLVVDMMELVKTQHSQLIRTVTHNTNMVVTLAKDSSDANKLLHLSVTQLAEKTDNNFQELQDVVQEISNSSGKICVDNEKPNEETVSQHVPDDLFPKNTTDKTSVASSTTEAAVKSSNVSEPRVKIGKQHDTGVLKITSDDIKPLADNSSVPSASELKPVIVKPSRPLTLDSSIIQVIELMSSNLTHSQKDALLRFLNSTISLDNLEAVIQNTEAEPDDDASLEIYEAETLNKTADEESSTVGNYRILDVTTEMENISEENNDDLMQNEATTIEILVNGTLQTGNDTEGTADNKNEVKTFGISDNLKTQLQYYALVMKIKQGNLNISEFWKPSQVSFANGGQNQTYLFTTIEKLCYGEENVQSLTSDRASSKMREQLLLINQIVSDKNLCERIENICNTMAELFTTDNTNNEIL